MALPHDVGLKYHFLADAVARDDGDVERAHRGRHKNFPCLPGRWFSGSTGS
jgi:hypothetical protein